MSWKGLRHKGTEVLRSSEWNTVIDALDELHGILTDGEHDINVRNINAHSGTFSGSLYVQGRAVLRDGDPITVSDFGDTAVGQITQAIDQSSLLSAILAEFAPVYAQTVLNATENTDGAELILDKGGRPYVSLYYNLGGPGELYVEVSTDGVHWRVLDQRVFDTAPATGMLSYANVAHGLIRARVPTAGIDVELELVASR